MVELLPERDDLLIQDRHFIVQPAVHVVVPEIPVLVSYPVFEVREHLIFGVAPHLHCARSQWRVHERALAARMGYYIVHLIAVLFEVTKALIQLLVSGQFLCPPGDALAAEGLISTRCAAEGEYGVALLCLQRAISACFSWLGVL